MKYITTKKAIVLTGFIILVLVCSFVSYWNRNIMPAIFPQLKIAFETSMEPVDIYLGDVHYRVPKAYLYWPAHMNGGKLKNFSMRANIDENMVPWTVSKNYERRIKDGMVTVNIYANFLKQYKDLTTQEKIKEYNEKMAWEQIERILEMGRKSFPERYNEIDKGVYRGIFHRYDDIGKIDSSNIDGHGSGVYLVPQIKTEKSFFIRCTSSVTQNSEHLCDVITHLKTGIRYEFKIPFHSVDQFLEWDVKVDDLISKLIVRNN